MTERVPCWQYLHRPVYNKKSVIPTTDKNETCTHVLANKFKWHWSVG